MKPSHLALLFSIFLLPAFNANAADSMLRVSCEGDDVGAEVYVNGKFKGECPVDFKVRAGTLKLRVQKKIDASNERVYEQELRMAEDSVKKVEAVLSVQLTAEGQRLKQEAERLRLAKVTELKRMGFEPGKVFRDCSDCPEMVVIPAGSFDMGSPSHEGGRYDNEGPQHRVTINQAFALGKTLITRGQFAAFVAATGYDAGGKCWVYEAEYKELSGRNWRDPGFRQDDAHPVICIDWNDAKAYVQWLAGKTGKPYRLPAETEWEYAARAGTDTARYWGDSPDQACGYANVADETTKAQIARRTSWAVHNCTDGYAYTAPVGSFKPNAFGLYDMLGNANQWLEDPWHDNYTGAPADGSVWQGDGVARVARGGSWLGVPKEARAAYRPSGGPAIRFVTDGFRLARTLP